MKATEIMARIAAMQEARKNIKPEVKRGVHIIQTTLQAIKRGDPITFNAPFFEGKGLIKRYGVDIDNKTRWVVTAKGEAILNAASQL